MSEHCYRLNRKQRVFIDEYLLNPNASRAALKAGYSPRTAYSQGHRLLKNAEVAAELRRRQRAKAKELDLSSDRVLRETARIAFSRLTDYVQVLPGNRLRVTPTADLTDDMVAAVASISQSGRGKAMAGVPWTFKSVAEGLI